MGNNLFAYCHNNPTNLSDSDGNWPKFVTSIANAVKNAVTKVIAAVKAAFSSSQNIVTASSHDANRRPNRGTPGSTHHSPNGDKRTFGPDGRPQRDYDHDDHGQPAQHPHDENGGHFHDWDWTNKENPRGPAYANGLDILEGIGMLGLCTIGAAIVAADDLTCIGVVDDFLLAPLSAGVGKGLILILG